MKWEWGEEEESVGAIGRKKSEDDASFLYGHGHYSVGIFYASRLLRKITKHNKKNHEDQGERETL